MTAQQILDAPDLIQVGVAGDDARRAMHGAETTFARVYEIHVDAPPQALPPGVQAGEFRIVGAPASLDVAVTAVKAAAALAGGVPVTGFSVADLAALGRLDDVARALKSAGLAAIAHLPIDGVEDAPAAARQIRDGGLTINTITIERLSDEARLDLCDKAQRLQASDGGFKAFAPLPRTISITKATTGYDDVKMVALARTVVTNVPSIQVDWQLYGPKMAQVALTVGADDIDNVSPVDAGVLGTRRSPVEEIKRNITSAGLEPVERDGLFAANSKLQTSNYK